MRVVLLCHNYLPHPGGLEVIVNELASGLALRHDVAVITSSWKGRWGAAREGAVQVVRLPAIHLLEKLSVPYPIPFGPCLMEARRLLSTADLLHAHGALYLASAAAARIRRSRGVPLVVTEHVGFVRYSSELLNRVQRIAWRTIGRYVVRSADAMTTYNLRVFDHLRQRQDVKRLLFVPNGVDTSTFHPLGAAARAAARCRFGLPGEERLVLFAGRESEKKNLPTVLAIPREGFRLVVCGAVRRLPEDVINLGLVPRDAMPELYGAVDALVHAGSGEGFPLAVQEAIATGLPTVLLWDQGYQGTLSREVVLAIDELSELAEGVRGLMGDPASRHRLGAAGREWAVENWSWARTVRSYEEIYVACGEGNR